MAKVKANNNNAIKTGVAYSIPMAGSNLELLRVNNLILSNKVRTIDTFIKVSVNGKLIEVF